MGRSFGVNYQLCVVFTLHSTEAPSGQGMRLRGYGHHRPASTTATPLPSALLCEFSLRIHLNKGFCSGKMFEKCCSRVLGPANLRLYSLLVALILSRTSGATVYIVFHLQGKLNWNSTYIFYNFSYAGQFLLLPGMPGTWKATPAAFRSFLYKAAK